MRTPFSPLRNTLVSLCATTARAGTTCAMAALLLTACGGGEGSGDSALSQDRGAPASSEQAAALSPGQEQAQLDKGAELSRADLQGAEAQAQAVDAGASTPLEQLRPGAIAAKAD